MTQIEIRDLRTALALTEPQLARLLDVDPRSIARWESGSTEPTASARAVLVGLRRALEENPDHVREVVTDVLEVGGLGLLIEKLLGGKR